MKCVPGTAGCIVLLLTSGLALLVANRPAVASSLKTITCPYLQAEDLRFDVPANLGDLPTIDFDYPAKVTIFSFRDGHLLLVAMDESEPSRLRIIISAQINKPAELTMGSSWSTWAVTSCSSTVGRSVAGSAADNNKNRSAIGSATSGSCGPATGRNVALGAKRAL